MIGEIPVSELAEIYEVRISDFYDDCYECP